MCNRGEINLGKLTPYEVHEKLFPFIKQKSTEGIYICVKVDSASNYYLSVLISLCHDVIVIDPRIGDQPFTFYDLGCPPNLTCITYTGTKFGVSEFIGTFENNVYTKRFYPGSLHLNECEPLDYTFDTALYEIYPVGTSLEKRIEKSRDYVWSLIEKSSQHTPELDYYDPDKPPTDEQNRWKKVVHRFRTEWIEIDEEAAMTPQAASETSKEW